MVRALQLEAGWSQGQFVAGSPLRGYDKGLVFTAQRQVTETYYAPQLRCRAEEEPLPFYCKADLPQPTPGTVHMSCWLWAEPTPGLLGKASSVAASIIPDPPGWESEVVEATQNHKS